MSEIVLQPIGRVVGGRVPLEDDDWADVKATVRLDGRRFGPESVAGLSAFSHLEVVFHLDQVPADKVETGARRPRGNPEWPEVGIFAQRGKNRPNRLGVSRCRLLDVRGLDLVVSGLDAVDGTPIVDVKPWMREFGPRGEIAQPAWSVQLMRGYY